MIPKLEPILGAMGQKIGEVLSKLAHAPLEVRVPQAEIKKAHELVEELASQELVILSSRMTHDLQGIILFSLSQEAARALVDLVLNRDRGQTQHLLETERNALEEIANIVTGSSLAVFSRGAGFKDVLHIAPVFSIGAVSAVANQLISPLYTKGDESLLLMEIVFAFGGSGVKGNLILILESPDVESALARLS